MTLVVAEVVGPNKPKPTLKTGVLNQPSLLIQPVSLSNTSS